MFKCITYFCSDNICSDINVEIHFVHVCYRRSRVGWSVIVPLLQQSESLHASASQHTDTVQPSIMIHHSRNTAAKQWDETRALIFTGCVKIIVAMQHRLPEIDKFDEFWRAILSFSKACALHPSQEVVIATATGFLVHSFSVVALLSPPLTARGSRS
jgi:hypothetical protein